MTEKEKRLEEAEKRLKEHVIVNLRALCVLGSIEKESIRRGFINENYEPVRPQLLSSKEFKKCWEFIAKFYALAMAKEHPEEEYTDDELYLGFTLFLIKVKKVLNGIQEYKNIETIMNHSGISRKNWMKFLDYYFQAR